MEILLLSVIALNTVLFSGTILAFVVYMFKTTKPKEEVQHKQPIENFDEKDSYFPMGADNLHNLEDFIPDFKKKITVKIDEQDNITPLENAN
jgi:hypothetical protein